MNLKLLARRIRDHSLVLRPLSMGLRVFRSMGMLRGERVYRHVPYRGLVTVHLPGGRLFRIVAHGGVIENGLYWDGLFSHEPSSMRAWIEYAKDAACVLDIGANSGIFALAACGAGAKHVHAFEPMPRVREVLRENCHANVFNNLQLWPYAVGDECGTATLYDPGGDAPTSASLSSDFALAHFGELPGINVDVVTIDEFRRRHEIGHVDLIKLDVEGHEEHALRGMRETVLSCRPVILMEVLDEYEEQLRSAVSVLFGDCYEWSRIVEGDGGPDRNVLLKPRSSHAIQ